MKTIKDLKIKIFLDGAGIEDIKKMSGLDYIKGFTTNPTLMKKAGVANYEKFLSDILPLAKEKPISFEVISDDFNEMKAQAVKLSEFGDNVFVKIPITNTKGYSSLSIINDLTQSGVKVNVTAMMNPRQVQDLIRTVSPKAPMILSIFAGRIADTGIDPVPIMRECHSLLKSFKNAELLWASPRELLNIFQAEGAGCDIITVPPEILAKLNLIGYDLNNYSLDTVKQFYNDAVSSGLAL
ncbi:transaldolase [bacterium]|nr:MAG: transaldolase [bacterium]